MRGCLGVKLPHCFRIVSAKMAFWWCANNDAAAVVNLPQGTDPGKARAVINPNNYSARSYLANQPRHALSWLTRHAGTRKGKKLTLRKIFRRVGARRARKGKVNVECPSLDTRGARRARKGKVSFRRIQRNVATHAPRTRARYFFRVVCRVVGAGGCSRLT